MQFHKNNIHAAIYLCLFFATLVPFFIKPKLQDNNNWVRKELFNADLSPINSISKANLYIDSIVTAINNQNTDTLLYVKEASVFTKERFYHGLSYYSISDNWIASLLGKLLWTHLSAIVKPDDILKHAEGLCNQQTMVFMEILKQKGIKVRKIGLGYKEGPGHFLCEVYYNGGWHLHDVTMEPKWEKVSNDHLSMSYYLNNRDSLYAVYQYEYNRALFDKLLQKVEYGKVNQFPAKNMLMFHEITKIITYLLPILFGLLFFKKTFGK